MTANLTPQERDELAAEYALGVLVGDDLAQAESLARSSATFRTAVARWRSRLAPLLNEIEPAAPPAGLWERIEQVIGVPERGNVVVLRRRVVVWRTATAAMTALAASLAIVLLNAPSVRSPVVSGPGAPAVQAKAPMVAVLDTGQQAKVMASWDPMSQRLVLAVAGDMPSDPAHSHELWVIPPGGQPRSIGTMGSAKQMHMRLADAIATLLQQGATIAITVEPPGGSPSGKPTGRMVASGALTSA